MESKYRIVIELDGNLGTKDVMAMIHLLNRALPVPNPLTTSIHSECLKDGEWLEMEQWTSA